MALHPWPSLFATRRRVEIDLTQQLTFPVKSRARDEPAISVDFGRGRARGRVCHTLRRHDRYRRPGRHLEPRGPRRRGRCRRLRDAARRGRHPRRRVRGRPTPGASRSSTAPGLAAAMDELGAISDLAARAANYAHLRFAADTDDEANGALVAKVSELATAIETKLVFFDLEWAEIDDARRRPAARVGRPRARAPSPAQRAPLPPAPPERGRGEADGREVGHRQRGLVAPLQRADERDPRRSSGRRRAAPARRRAEPPAAPRPRDRAARPPRRSAPRWPPACARAPTSSTRSRRTRRPTTGCAATAPGCRAATSATRPATSRCAHCSRRPRAPTTCRSAGTG